MADDRFSQPCHLFPESPIAHIEYGNGLILLFGNGFVGGEGFPLPRILHAIVMILAVVAGHLAGRGKTDPAKTRYRRALTAIAVSLVLILIGIIIIAAGQGS